MLYNALTSCFTKGVSLGQMPWRQLISALRERYTFAPFDEVLRWGIYEQQLVSHILESCGEEPADIVPDFIAWLPVHSERKLARTVETNPRVIYTTIVAPRASPAGAYGREDTTFAELPPLSLDEAREISLAVLMRLQERCAYIALSDGGDEMRTAMRDAVNTATLAEELFGTALVPDLIDDWGTGSPMEHRSISISIGTSLLHALHESIYLSCRELRLLLGESPIECDSIAFDIWHAEKELWGTSHIAYHCPLWWLHPTYRLPGMVDEHKWGIEQLFEPMARLAKRAVTPADSTELLLSPHAARGLAAILGIMLARRLYAEQSVLGAERLRPWEKPVYVEEIASTHARILRIV